MTDKALSLRTLFKSKPILRIVGAHDGLGAKLIEKNHFDGIWASGLEIATSHGVPDANILTMSENLHAACVINDATVLPVICDCDTGFGNVSNVIRMVEKYEAAGIAAVVIEDKCFPKVNSFVPGRQELASIQEFVGKIEAAKSAQKNPNFMVFARVEALIAGWGMEEAVRRATAYVEAGADGIVIHSKAVTPDEVFTFAQKWASPIPLVVIPTTYFDVTADQFSKNGFKMVIYANQGLRASIRAMDETFKSIHETDSTAQVEDKITTMKEVFKLQGMLDLKEDEKRFDKKETIQAVIPAAGEPRSQSSLEPLLKGRPICMLEIGGKTLIDHQADALRSCGVNDIIVVGGYQSEKIKADGATILCNPDYKITNSADSFFHAENYFKQKCVMIFSDVIFDRQILENLLRSPHAITLVIDRAYQTLPFREKKLDLVVVEELRQNGRHLLLSHLKPIKKIGHGLDKSKATHEFIGMAFFQGEGLKAVNRIWKEEIIRHKKADLVDFMQVVIDRGQAVYGMEIEHGWSELHSMGDVERVNAHFMANNVIASPGGAKQSVCS